MQQKILNIAHARTLDVGNLLAYIVEIYGKDVYLNPLQLVGLLADLMREDNKTKRFYRRAILEDYLAEKIYHIIEQFGNDNVRIASLTTIFAENNAYTKDFAEIIVFNFSRGLGYKKTLPIPVYKNGKYGFILEDGTEIVSLKYDGAGNFSEGLAYVHLVDLLDFYYGYIDECGKEVIPCEQYGFAVDFSEGLAPKQVFDSWGYINKSNETIIPYEFEYADDFYDGMAAVMIKSKIGYIDQLGKIIIPPIYDFDYEDRRFIEGLAAVSLNGKYGYIDKSGKTIIPHVYDLAYNFSEGLARVCMTYSGFAPADYWYVDKFGNKINSYKYDGAGNFSEGLAPVMINGEWIYIDKFGNVVISSGYDYAESFFNGLARVKSNGKWGYINKEGKEVISLKYDRAENFFVELAEVMLYNEEFYIDRTGKRVYPKE